MQPVPVRLTLLIAVATAGPTGCIRAPQATLTLSEVVGEQISAVRASHEAFVRLYYARLRQDVDQFLTQVWVPSFLRRAVANQQFRSQLDVAYAVASLDANAINVSVTGEANLPPAVRAALRQAIDSALQQHRARLGVVMLDFATEVERQITLRRDSLLLPIDEQERFVLAQLADVYADLQRSQSSISAYLGSAVRVQQEQDVILRKLGLLEAQKQALGFAGDASDAAATALTGAAGAESAIAKFLETFKATKDSLAKLKPK
ncbi:MAG TPA: hypothetical protein VGA78_15860 [Gemmatimonadales bacterium]